MRSWCRTVSSPDYHDQYHQGHLDSDAEHAGVSAALAGATTKPIVSNSKTTNNNLLFSNY